LLSADRDFPCCLWSYQARWCASSSCYTFFLVFFSYLIIANLPRLVLSLASFQKFRLIKLFEFLSKSVDVVPYLLPLLSLLFVLFGFRNTSTAWLWVISVFANIWALHSLTTHLILPIKVSWWESTVGIILFDDMFWGFVAGLFVKLINCSLVFRQLNVVPSIGLNLNCIWVQRLLLVILTLFSFMDFLSILLFTLDLHRVLTR
jgi:hypothetical protein